MENFPVNQNLSFLRPATRASLFFILCLAFVCCVSLPASGQGLTSYWNNREQSEHVFFVGTDRQVHELYYINKRWHHNSIGARLDAWTVLPRSPLAGFFGGDVQHVFYVASVPGSNDGASLRELYYDRRGWHIGYPNGGAPAGIKPANYVIAPGGDVSGDWYTYGLTAFWDGTYEHVFAVTSNNIHLSELYKSHSSSWTFNFLNEAPRNARPSPSVPMTGFYDFKQKEEHVFYIGETSDPDTQHLYELSHNTRWWPEDLTASGAPAPTGNRGTGGLMSFTDGTMDHVFYSTVSGSVIEMAHRAAGGPWTHSTLPLPIGAGALTGFNDGSYQHVFYMGNDGHVHEMYRTGANGDWQTNDLTKLTESPSPTCGITSFFDGSVEHVFYVGQDSHVHELYHDKSWHHNDLTRVLVGENAPDAEICFEPNGNSQ
jgi:hypothetical protein